MSTKTQPPHQRNGPPARGFNGPQRQRGGRDVERPNAELHPSSEQSCCRPDADDGVIARILQRIDCVVADRPREGGCVKEDGRDREAPEGWAPTPQRSPPEKKGPTPPVAKRSCASSMGKRRQRQARRSRA